MSYPIPLLENIVIGLAILYPGGLATFVPGFREKAGREGSMSATLGYLLFCHVVLLVVIAIARPDRVLFFNLPASPLLVVLAPLVGLACIGLEYLVGMGLVYLRTRRLVTRAAVHEVYAATPRIGLNYLVLVLALVVVEELTFRQVAYGLMLTDFAWPLGMVVALCAVLYAVNHLPFGFDAMVQKLVSGVLYVLLYHFSGLSLVVVVLAHATQNLTLLALSQRKRA